MKKAFIGFLVFVMLLSLVACGNTTSKLESDEADSSEAGNSQVQENEDWFTGTWNISSVEIDGSTFTIDEIEAMGDTSLSDFQIVIKDGGKAYVYSNGEGTLVDWKATESGISIGIRECTFDESKQLNLEINGNKLILSKTSDDQSITSPSDGKETDESKELSNDSELDSESTLSEKNTPAKTEGLRPEFKEAMDSYEAFYDDYCDFMKEYEENPSDLKMLTEYTKMMEQLTEMNEKFDAWQDEDLNDEELEYYIDVNTRITKKLLEVA